MMRTLRGFILKEFRQALRDPRMRLVIFLIPLIQLTIFGVAISNEVKNIRLWAQVSPYDSVLQHIYTRATTSHWFLKTEFDPGADPFELLRAGRVDAVLVPPPGGLTRALGQGSADLQLLVNATNVVLAQSVEGYLKAIINQVLAEDLNIPTIQRPIEIDVRVLYNPSLETTYFMVPGVMSMLLCVITIMLTSLSITREKEMGTFEMLISAPVRASEVIFGKTIPYVVLGMSNVPLVLAVAVLVFGVPMRGSFFALMLASFAFVCTTVAVGTLISTFAQNQQQSTIASFLFLFPSILLSGMMFPLENMPEAMKWVAYCNPLSHYLSLMRNILLKGGEPHFIALHIGILFLMAAITVVVSFKRFRTNLT